MAWIESHEGLRSHPKTMKAARLLSIPIPQVIGHLHCFWWWALNYAEKGCMAKYDSADISDGAMWTGDPDLFVKALVDARFIDVREGQLVIHDWDEYIGRLMEIRERERVRKSKWVRNARGHSGENPVNEPNGTGNRRGVDAEATRNRRGSDAEGTRNSEVDLTEPNLTEPEEQPETSDEVSGARGADSPRGFPEASSVPAVGPELEETLGNGELAGNRGTGHAPGSRDKPRENPEVTRERIPAAFRETYDLFLLKTGRGSISREELARIEALERLHIPSRVQSEISKALERFGRSGRAPCELDWNYLWDSLRHQKTGKTAPGGKGNGSSESGGGRRHDPKWLKQLEAWEKGT